MPDCSEEVGVDWVNGLVLHAGDSEWHPWDGSIYDPLPDREREDG